MFIINSTWRNNRVGIVPNSGSYELCYPQRDVVVAGNLVYSNNQGDTPAINDAILAMGNGILVAGGIGNTVGQQPGLGSRQDRHRPRAVPRGGRPSTTSRPRTSGTGPARRPSRTRSNMEPPDLNLWNPLNNTVTGNVVSESGVADLTIASVDVDLSTLGNCFAGNEFTTSAPEDLETLAPCDGEGQPGTGRRARSTWLRGSPRRRTRRRRRRTTRRRRRRSSPRRTCPTRPRHRRTPPTTSSIDVDVAAIAVPDAPAG